MMLCNLVEGKPLFAMFASICFFYFFTIGKTFGHNICKNMVFLLNFNPHSDIALYGRSNNSLLGKSDIEKIGYIFNGRSK